MSVYSGDISPYSDLWSNDYGASCRKMIQQHKMLLIVPWLGIQYPIQPFYQSDDTHGNKPGVVSVGLKKSMWDIMSKPQRFCKPLVLLFLELL